MEGGASHTPGGRLPVGTRHDSPVQPLSFPPVTATVLGPVLSSTNAPSSLRKIFVPLGADPHLELTVLAPLTNILRVVVGDIF